VWPAPPPQGGVGFAAPAGFAMSSTRQKTFSRIDLVADLREAGIEAGDVVVVHSALSRVGWILGGPHEMVRALTEAVGPRGTIVMPTFSFNLASWHLPPFDPWRTMSRVGVLTEAFRVAPDVHRTHHPTHSVAARGRLAQDIVAGPIGYEPLGIGSPLDRVRHADGKILLMGVGNNRNSTVHLAASLAGMPCLTIPFIDGAREESAWYIDARGATARHLAIREVPGSSEGFDALDAILPERGVAREATIGDAPAWIMGSRELCDVVVELLGEDPLYLLRGANPSEISLRRRRHMQSQLEKEGNTA